MILKNYLVIFSLIALNFIAITRCGRHSSLSSSTSDVLTNSSVRSGSDNAQFVDSDNKTTKNAFSERIQQVQRSLSVRQSQKDSYNGIRVRQNDANFIVIEPNQNVAEMDFVKSNQNRSDNKTKKKQTSASDKVELSNKSNQNDSSKGNQNSSDNKAKRNPKSSDKVKQNASGKPNRNGSENVLKIDRSDSQFISIEPIYGAGSHQKGSDKGSQNSSDNGAKKSTDNGRYHSASTIANRVHSEPFIGLQRRSNDIKNQKVAEIHQNVEEPGLQNEHPILRRGRSMRTRKHGIGMQNISAEAAEMQKFHATNEKQPTVAELLKRYEKQKEEVDDVADVAEKEEVPQPKHEKKRTLSMDDVARINLLHMKHRADEETRRKFEKHGLLPEFERMNEDKRQNSAAVESIRNSRNSYERRVLSVDSPGAEKSDGEMRRESSMDILWNLDDNGITMEHVKRNPSNDLPKLVHGTRAHSGPVTGHINRSLLSHPFTLQKEFSESSKIGGSDRYFGRSKEPTGLKRTLSTHQTLQAVASKLSDIVSRISSSGSSISRRSNGKDLLSKLKPELEEYASIYADDDDFPYGPKTDVELLIDQLNAALFEKRRCGGSSLSWNCTLKFPIRTFFMVQSERLALCNAWADVAEKVRHMLRAWDKLRRRQLDKGKSPNLLWGCFVVQKLEVEVGEGIYDIQQIMDHLQNAHEYVFHGRGRNPGLCAVLEPKKWAEQIKHFKNEAERLKYGETPMC